MGSSMRIFMEEFRGDSGTTPVTVKPSKPFPDTDPRLPETGSSMIFPIASALPKNFQATVCEITTEWISFKQVLLFPSINGKVKTEKKLSST